jgi:predicted permease
MSESAVLSGLGGAGGIVISFLTLPLLIRSLPTTLPRSEAIGIDARVLAFGIFMTAMTAAVAGVLPAIQVARTQPRQVMDATGRGLAGGRAGERARAVLVVAEVALAFSLLVGATLLATSFVRLWTVDRGFTTEGLIAMTIFPDPLVYPEREDQMRFQAELRDRLEAIPGVRVSIANQIPLSGSTSSTTYHVDRPDGSVQDFTVMISVVGEDYLEVLGVPLMQGRSFGAADFEEGLTVGIVNEALADRFWPGESAVGKTLRAKVDSPATTIVGVVRNVRHQGLNEPAQPKLYITLGQSQREGFQWLIRARGNPSGVIELARQAVAAVSPTTPVRRAEILDERIARSVTVQRFRTYFVVGLAAMATVLALLGVYGVLSFAVSQRTREFAVRMAIGALPRRVVAETLRKGLLLATGGIVIGLIVARGTARLVTEFLYEIDASNPVVYILAALLIGGVGLLASYLPARRASRVHPASVLKAE